DDYAHHPAEINAVHSAVREMYPNKRVLAVFQPHLFSRTRDFMEEFAASLAQFDELLLLDIYPAREEPIEGVTSEKLLELIPLTRKEVISKAQLEEKLQASKATIKVMMGAGDIGEEILKLAKTLAV
ncbi:MAG TPA: UDP-N-acetylmuramate--L-alanine ligase, partial [Leeuwenhoekiella sp.]|nr:UDP-N-acetylmuramate--L-alanine ligase [Leeuwenhoekiella sp.]